MDKFEGVKRVSISGGVICTSVTNKTLTSGKVAIVWGSTVEFYLNGMLNINDHSEILWHDFQMTFGAFEEAQSAAANWILG